MNWAAIKKATDDAHGVVKPFKQSAITKKYRERDSELYPGGICLALSVFYLSRENGRTFNDLVAGVYLKPLDEAENEPLFAAQVQEIMMRQQRIKKGKSGTKNKNFIETFVPFVEWMKELAPRYGLELIGANTGEALNPGVIAREVLRSQNGYVLGFGGGGGGHAVAARNDGEKIAFFDPNCGSFQIPSNNFSRWFVEFMYDSEYQQKYGTTFTSAAFR